MDTNGIPHISSFSFCLSIHLLSLIPDYVRRYSDSFLERSKRVVTLLLVVTQSRKWDFQNIADTLTYLHDSCVINDCAFYLPVALLTSFESLGTLVFVVVYRSFQEPDVVVGPVQPKLNHHLAAHSRAHRHNPISQLDLFLHPKKQQPTIAFLSRALPLRSVDCDFLSSRRVLRFVRHLSHTHPRFILEKNKPVYRQLRLSQSGRL
jgi:hypothetical protein